MDKLKANLTQHVTENFVASLARDIADCDPALPHRFAVAVSGGADSFALLYLAQQWAQQNNATIIALTVDHHLRPESADEAAQVATWCKNHGIEHHILHWTEEKPASGIQNAARVMRRTLLSEFCASNSIPFLLLGHQADDQAETFFMRLQRGSGLTGLSAIKSHRVDDAHKLHILRPLLSMRRADLRAFCDAHRLPFIDDPSNENIAYERVRVRQDLATFPDLADGVARATLRLQRADLALQQITDTWITNHLRMIDSDTWWIPRHAFLENPDEICLRILEHMCERTTHKPIISLGDLEHWYDDMTNDAFTGMNIAGCWARPKTVDRIQGIAFQAEPERKPLL